MLIVKVTTERANETLADFLPYGSSEWGNCRFLVNQDVATCDYWMVIDGLHGPETTVCPPEHVFLFTGEPESIRTYGRVFMRQFAAVVTSQRGLRHPNVIHAPPPIGWMVKQSYDEVIAQSIVKTETLTMMTSGTKGPMNKGGRRRYRFALRLKAHFGDALQLYGRGIQPVDDKWTVHAPFRYAVVVENSHYQDYFTEKIADCLLSETFPFYDGCPNIDDYFDGEAFLKIDVDDFAGTVAAIERVLADPGHYERHLPALRQAKARYLREYSLFARLSRYAKDDPRPGQAITLVPERPGFRPVGLRAKLWSPVKTVVRWVKRRFPVVARIIRRLRASYDAEPTR